ncbi:hypothetical protein JD541_10835 [Aeromonas dhakensis]|uniref:hypothetical protein n=1 Tax=Aeromonas dhakensis TaxID=196024 RepID=UPI001116FFC0|nr:hypothetical protein [Aeromonas dhakensis]MBL0533473.1 hypothetical protein [Aeromonas dhakensis]
MLDSISKVYFHELDAREHIFNRLQLNFALYASVLAMIAYMTRMVDYNSQEAIVTLFYVCVFFSIMFLAKSAYLTYHSLTGMQYRLLPDPNELYKYRVNVRDHAKAISDYNKKYGTNEVVPDVEQVCKDFLAKMMTSCTSYNAGVNELRKLGIRRSLLFLVLSAVPLLLSSVLFIGFDLDASSPRKKLQVHNSELSSQFSTLSANLLKHIESEKIPPKYIYSEVKVMCEDKKKETPPPPPPPPPIEPTWQVATESYSPPTKTNKDSGSKPKE